MKKYIVYCCKSYKCVIDGKEYTPRRAMVAVLDDNGCIVQIKLIKCASDFAPTLDKKVQIFYDDNGKAVAYKLAE